MSFTKIATAGAGTMGSQVAWQMAFHNKQVIVYDAIPEGLEKGKALHRQYAEQFVRLRGATQEQIDDTFGRLTYTTDLAAAVGDADLISESVPESVSIKESFWREASRHAPSGLCSPPTAQRCRRARWWASLIGRSSSWPCTLPLACGTRTSAR